MPEKTKPETYNQEQIEKEGEKSIPEENKDSWSEDQKEKSYYYDDAHGYEIYDPEKDDEDDN